VFVSTFLNEFYSKIIAALREEREERREEREEHNKRALSAPSAR
jgi:hypothetical protein